MRMELDSGARLQEPSGNPNQGSLVFQNCSCFDLWTWCLDCVAWCEFEFGINACKLQLKFC
jgi:hypothetical protein